MDNKNLPPMGNVRTESLGRVVISMLAIGISAGLTLIAAAKKLGEAIAEDKIKD